VTVRQGKDGLAGLLSDLKQRSGLSYAELARRTYTSSSTLHRYCTGRGHPPDYQLVAMIGQECGASDEELNELLRRWRHLTGHPSDPPTAQATDPPENRPRARLTMAVLATRTRHRAHVTMAALTRRRARPAMAVPATLALLVVASSASGTTGAGGGAAEPVEAITATSWVTNPQPVSAAARRACPPDCPATCGSASSPTRRTAL
jgi:transcriptional regulator with XRE-family HTH domain